jgi:hypothetical protein
MKTNADTGKQVVSKFKWFWHYQDAQREVWLRQMAQQGLHLQKVGWAGLRHTFVVGVPADITYRLDFSLSYKTDPDYLQLLSDAGWQYVSVAHGWQIWRKPVLPGQQAELFSDAPSKIVKYRRLLQMYSLCVLLPALAILRPWQLRYSFEDEPVYAGAHIVYLFVLLLAAYDVMGILLRIRELKKAA